MSGERLSKASGPVGICVRLKGRRNGIASDRHETGEQQNIQQTFSGKHNRPI